MMSIDKAICEFDTALRTVFGVVHSLRPIPGQNLEDTLPSSEKKQAAALMRVNHTGEVCAQALYQGQALSCQDDQTSEKLEHAALEETEHLAWTSSRIEELGGRKSLLNPLWYGGSWAIGFVAGSFGSAWNLGFLAETEKQVEAHLDLHLQHLHPKDQKSAVILEQMREDEAAHAQMAIDHGGRTLPLPVKLVMRFASKVMTKTAYHL